MLSDGQWVVRQLELHPSKQYKSLLLGCQAQWHEYVAMCKLSLESG